MNPDKAKTHYQLLEVPAGASPLEIRDAYRKLCELYQSDSMAACSFFTDAERREILQRLEEVYLALTDPEARALYDQMLLEKGIIDPDEPYRGKPMEPASIYAIRRRGSAFRWQSGIPQEASLPVPANDTVREILKKELLSGEDLKRIRTALEVPLERIFLQTKVTVSILEAIEGDRIDQLPPRTYLKGFLKAYALSLRLDPDTVVQGYIRHLEKR